MWNSILPVLRKEFLHIFRDRATLVMVISVPIFQLTLFGFLDLTVKDLPTVIVDQDRSTEARQLIDQLKESRTFQVTHVTSSAHAARDDLISGRARVGIILPPDLHGRIAKRRNANLLVLIDGSDSTAASQALASINGLIANRNLSVVNVTPPLEAHPVLLFNPAGRTADYIIPALIVIIMQISAVALSSTAIVRERERGTLEQLLVTPIEPLGLLLGKLVPYLVLGLIQMSVILVIMTLGFGVPIRGNLAFLFAMATIYLIALLATGFFISTRAQTQPQAFQMAQLTLLPSIFLSGYIFPFSGLPWPLQAIGLTLPATHMVSIMRGVVLRNAGLAHLWPNVVALSVIGVLLVLFSVRQFNRVSI